jgi:membrane-associated protease RseP (regulator of RpoE activity)
MFHRGHLLYQSVLVLLVITSSVVEAQAPSTGMRVRPDDLVVINAYGGSIASEAGILPGDRILSVNSKPVRTLEEMRKALQSAFPTATVRVQRASKSVELVFLMSPTDAGERRKSMGQAKADPSVSESAKAQLDSTAVATLCARADSGKDAKSKQGCVLRDQRPPIKIY